MNPAPLVSPRDALDIVFAHRNRAYGAYALRRGYPTNLARALGLTLLFVALALLLPRLFGALPGPSLPTPPDESRMYEVAPPPDIAPLPPMPPPVATPPPAARNTNRFVPPLILPNEQAPAASNALSTEQILKTPGEVGVSQISNAPGGPPGDLPPELPRGALETAGEPKDEVHLPTDLQRLPSFPGGDQALFEYLNRNIKYPKLAQETGIQGVATLTFVVGKDGGISEVAVIKEPGAGCGREAVRVVSAMPRWIPGEANGHPVRVRFTLPVRFRLRD